MRPDGIKHHAKNGDENDQADDEHHPVKPDHVTRNLGHALSQIELIDAGTSRHVLHLCAGDATQPVIGIRFIEYQVTGEYQFDRSHSWAELQFAIAD